MNKFGYYPIAIIFVLLSFSGCKKSDQSTDPVIPGNVLFEYVVNTFSSASGGVNSQIDSAIRCSAGNYKLDTNYNIHYNIRINDSVSGIKYDFTTSYNFNKSLSPTLQFNFFYSANGTCETPAVSVSENSSASYIITGLEQSYPVYLFKGNGSQGGTETSKDHNMTFSFSSTYTLDFQIPKVQYAPYAGLASLTITGTGPNNASFHYDLSITIYEGWATFTFNGSPYSFNIITGAPH
jgi:hypothetical protein